MDNVNQPQGNGPQEHSPTQPQRFTPSGGPGDPSAYGQPPQGQQYPGNPWLARSDPHRQQTGGPDPYAQQFSGQNPPTQQLPTPGFQPPKQKRRWMQNRKARWGAGIATAVILGAGGTLAGLELTGSGTSAPPANAAQATALNSAMGYTTGCSLSSIKANQGSAAIQADRANLRRCLRARLRVITGMYGQIAYHTKTGTQTLAFERGLVVSTGGGQLSVRAEDGTTWTWDEASSPIIRESGKQASISALENGTRVFVGGLADGSSREARVIIVHAAQSGSGKKPAHGKKSSKSSSSSSSSGGSPGTTT